MKKPNHEWIESKINAMTLEEKVGQVLIIKYDKLTSENHCTIINHIQQYHLGGIFHFDVPLDDLSEGAFVFQQVSKVPIFIISDFECGLGHKLSEITPFPYSMARGAAGDDDLEYEIGKIIALQARAIGCNMSFSPVIDLNTQRLCPDVNIRAYGETAETVCRMAIPLINGMQENQFLAVIKHFPGNGGTDMDQHICTAIMPQKREEMEQFFLEPYRRIFKETDIAAVMVAHIEYPAFVTEINPRTGRLVPASVSKEVISDLLRKELGFNGLVITDAMNMGGITSQYIREEAAVKSLQAGADMLLIFFDDFEREYQAIITAVKTGIISLERLDDAVIRILTAKSQIGMDQDQGVPMMKKDRNEVLQKFDIQAINYKIASKALTLLRNRNNYLPIGNLSGQKVLILNTGNYDRETAMKLGEKYVEVIISKQLEARGGLVDTIQINKDLSVDELNLIIQKAPEYEYLFINLFMIPTWGAGTLIPNKSLMRLLNFGILTSARKVIITSFGDPFGFYYFPASDTFLCTYDCTIQSQLVAIQGWFGEIPINGKIPVSIPGMFQRGDGINICN